MNRLVTLLLALAPLLLNAQIFSGGNATKLRGNPIANPLACSDGQTLVWSASGGQWACGAGTGSSYTNGSGLSLVGTTFSVDFAVVPGLSATNTYSSTNDYSGGTLILPRASGVPSSGCSGASDVGKVDARSDAAASNSTLYVCAKTGSSTYAWELVQSAGGSSFSSGDFSAIPSCTTTPYFYKIKSGFYDGVGCDGASTKTYFLNGKAVTPPVVANWTTFGSVASTTTTNGAYQMTFANGQTAPAGIYTSVGSSYTKVIAMSWNLVWTGSSVDLSCGWRDSATGNVHAVRLNYNQASGYFPGLLIDRITSAGGSGGSRDYGVANIPSATTYYCKLQSDGTNRTASISLDNVNYISFWTGAASTYFTPDQLWVGSLQNQSGATFAVNLISYE